MKHEKNRIDFVIGMIEKCKSECYFGGKNCFTWFSGVYSFKRDDTSFGNENEPFRENCLFTGSPILSYDQLRDENLRQCEWLLLKKLQ